MDIEIKAKGHKNIKATHKTTLEITKDNYLTERGNCIIGISSTHSAYDLPEDLKEYLKNEGRIKIIIRVNDIEDKFFAYGDNKMTFLDKKSIVIRKSTYIDDRTIGILSEKSAIDIDRTIINYLKNSYDLYFKIEY